MELDQPQVKKSWPLAAALVVLVSAVYLNSLHGVFLFDDSDSIADNLTIKSLWPIWRPFLPPTGGATVSGRPIVNFSLAVNWAIGRMDVFSYHVVNALLHALAALTLYGLMRRTLLLPKWKGRFDANAADLAFAAAAIWALHPLQTESVTYIVQRAESLMGLFYLLTLYCSLRAFTDSLKLTVPWTLAAVAACAAGMGSKEVMVSAPLAVVLFDRFFLFDSFKETLRRRWMLYVGLALTWGILAVEVLTNSTRGGSAGFTGDITVWGYMQTQAVWICRYLWKTIWPGTLVLDYGKGLITGFGQIWPYATIILLLLAGTAAAICYRPWVGFLAILFWMILAPTSSFVPNVNQTAAEHRMYLPLAPLAVLAVMTVAWLWDRLMGRLKLSEDSRWLLGRVGLSGVLAVVLLLLAVRTIMRNEDYQSLERMWTQANRDYPDSPRLLQNMGSVYLEAGQFEDALKQYDRAVQVGPEYSHGYSGRADTFVHMAQASKSESERQRLYTQAAQDYAKAIELEPRDLGAYINRGVMYQQWGRKQQALDDYNKVLTIAPRHLRTRIRRAILEMDMGRLRDARDDLDFVLTYNADNVAALHMRAETLRKLGDLPRALDDASRALRIAPAGLTFVTRAEIYADMNQLAKAAEDAQQARELGMRIPAELARKLAGSTAK